MKKVIKEDKVLNDLLEEVSVNSEVKKRMSEEDLLKFVYENFNNEEIKSKNGMLKFLRSEGLSCSMDRVFKMYNLVEKNIVKEVKEVKEEEKVISVS